MNQRNLTSWSSLGVLALLFLALVMLSNILFRGARLDLTENNLYTLSEGTANILDDVSEPIQLRLFFSEEVSREFPQLRAYYQRVREMLEEFEQRSGGNVVVSVIDPQPFSEEEDQAARYGIQSVPLGNAGDNLYFGLAGTNAVDDVELIPFFHPNRERFLEYDLTKLVYRLDNPEMPKLGVVGSIELGGGFDPNTQASNPPYSIYEQLTQFFEVEEILADASELPEDLDALIVLHPKDFNESLTYAIDQFALGGGNVMIFVDPHAEVDRQQQGMPGMPPPAATGSDLPELFKAWGIEYDKSQFVADLRFALEVGMGQQGRVRHAAILGLNGEAMSSEDVVTASLSSVNLASAGHFQLAEGSSLNFEPLFWTSENAALMPTLRLQNLFNPASLLQDFEATGDIYNLAARVSGEVSSAFGDNPPDGVSNNEHRSSGEINAILVADSDLLSDAYWVQRSNFFGTVMLSPFAGNGDFVMNGAENLMGNADLISVRPRDVANRPFTLVEDLRVEAEQEFRETEQQLEQELTETENKINQMQQSRGDNDLAVLSAEQEAEVERFLDRKLEIRKELRQVRRNLDRDIENLGAWLKVFNILLAPLLVAVAAVFYFMRRRRRQEQAGAA